MKAIAMLFFMLGIVTFFMWDQRVDSRQVVRERAVAANFATFRSAVHQHVFDKGHRNPGDIAHSALPLPYGWKALRAWKATIKNGQCLVWGEATSEEIVTVRSLFNGSYAVGRAQGGKLVPGNGSNVAVPGIPDGSLVSIVNLD